MTCSPITVTTVVISTDFKYTAATPVPSNRSSRPFEQLRQGMKLRSYPADFFSPLTVRQCLDLLQIQWIEKSDGKWVEQLFVCKIVARPLSDRSTDHLYRRRSKPLYPVHTCR